MRRAQRKRPQQREWSEEVVFSFRIEGEGGSFQELVVTEEDEVLLSWRETGGKARLEPIDAGRREIGEFLWRVEGLGIARWMQRRASAVPSGGGRWHVALRTAQGYVTACGAGERPAGWEELMRLVEGLTGRSAG